MTAYRMDDFQEDEEDLDDLDLEPEIHDSKEQNIESKMQSDDAAVLGEVIEPRPVEIAKEKVEVKTEKVIFKTKCQLLQEESDNGT
jgi:hypothetical protein